MKQAIYYRKRNVIRSPHGDTGFASITVAKAESRKLQISADGATGRGSLRVVTEVTHISEIIRI